MKKEYLKKNWRKLDNVAKVFSLEDKQNFNTFRLSVILKEKINAKFLKLAIIEALEDYPSYKVKIKTGFFWNYLEANSNAPIVEEETQSPCKSINLRKNNEYLFKVTYFNNKINLDIFHVLTDGVGATSFMKTILYNYLNLKHKIKTKNQKTIKNDVFIEDEFLKKADKKILCHKENKKAFLFKGKFNLLKNKTYHYILNLKTLKDICKKNNVSITEYLTALYIYAIYKTAYDKSSKKDIAVTIPIDLRKHYNTESFANFFTCMNVFGDVSNKQKVSFEKVLNQVHEQFKSKLTRDNIKKYLARDVKLGTNMAIRLVPLAIKKAFMKYMSKMVNQSTTTTLSNIGPIQIEEKYKKYIDNIFVLVSTSKIQKAKCTVCSYEEKLTVTINSNLISNKLENEFHKLLIKYIGKVKIESNVTL